MIRATLRAMVTAIVTLLLTSDAQTPAASPKPPLAVISGRLGPCAADFTVTDASGSPVYAATIHVRIRYGLMSLKRMDLEVGTDSEGKARVEGLPVSAKPLVYEISSAGKKTTVEQNLATRCQATYPVSLK